MKFVRSKWPSHSDVDAGHGGNRLDVGEPLDRFDLRDHQRALVEGRDLGDDARRPR